MLDINFNEDSIYTFNGSQLRCLFDWNERYALSKDMYQRIFQEKYDEENKDVLETLTWEYEAKLEKFCRERLNK